MHFVYYLINCQPPACLRSLAQNTVAMLPAKPKCMFIVTTLAKPLMEIGTMVMSVMLFHFDQLGCMQSFR